LENFCIGALAPGGGQLLFAEYGVALKRPLERDFVTDVTRDSTSIPHEGVM
jgi:hypothetical protein